MNKKQILITVIGGVVVFILSFLLSYFISSKCTKSENALKVGSYTLEYGTYKGIEQEYDADKEKVVNKEMKVVLSTDKIVVGDISKKYEVKGSSIYVDGTEMYEVTANNKFILLAGSGVECVYEK